MQILLVITDTRRKNLFFASDERSVFPRTEAVARAERGEISGMRVVYGKSGSFLRTAPSVPEKKELEYLSISAPSLFSVIQGTRHAASTPQLSWNIETYLSSIEGQGSFVTPVGETKVPTAKIKERLQSYRSLIFKAAEQFDIDPYLLSAILIDEIARAHPYESILDAIGTTLLGLNTSTGVAQVKLTTANNLIRKGLYNPNPDDPKLPFNKLDSAARKHIYEYVRQPEHSISFAAAFLRGLIDEWSTHIDLATRPEIIATLYHLRYKSPHAHPQPNERGTQIYQEFYPLARTWLGDK